MKHRCKSAMITVELAVSLLLVVVVLFVTLGLFGDNIRDMVANGNFKNIFNGESIRTFFANWGKNYNTSQIDVQVMGEQGLEQLRRKANNNNLDLIEPNDHVVIGPAQTTALSEINANTIAYLAQIIYVIVGDKKVCSHMNKDSKEKCTAIGLDEKYNVEISGNALTVIANGKTIATGTLTQPASAALSSVSPTDDVTQKWKNIQAIQSSYPSGSLNSSFALTQDISYYQTQLSVGQGNGTSKIEDEIISLLGSTNTPTTGWFERDPYASAKSIIAIATAAASGDSKTGGCSDGDISCDTGGSLCGPTEKCSEHISQDDLNAIIKDITQITALILEQARKADSLANPVPTTISYLPVNFYSPSYNSYMAKLNTGSQSSIISGASTALLTPYLPVSPNGNPIVVGSSDAMIARYEPIMEDPGDGGEYVDVCDRPVPPKYCGNTYPPPPLIPQPDCSDPSNPQCSVTYTPTPDVTYTFAKDPIVSATPTDNRLASVPNTAIGMDVRAAILVAYSNMTSAVFPSYNLQSTLTADLIYRMNKDHIPFKGDDGQNTYLCQYAVKKLADIAYKHGLLSAHDDIINRLPQCYYPGYR